MPLFQNLYGAFRLQYKIPVLINELPEEVKRTLLLLVVTVTFSSTFDDDYDDDYSEEDKDYDTYFEPYDPGTSSMWDLTSVEVKNRPGPLNLKGILRKRLAMDLAKMNPEQSSVCSPVSVLLTLGKLALGAEGDCLSQLLPVLGLKKKTKMKKAFKPLIKNLEYLRGVNLKVISKIYVSNNVRIRSKYRRTTRKIFKSSVKSMDFENPAAAARKINDYVNSKTNGGIRSVVSEYDISPKTSILLVNTVFFTGYWAKPFKRIETTSFFSPRGTREVSMMNRIGQYKYGSSKPLDAQLVEIPYEGQSTLLVILPNKKHGLPMLLDKVSMSPQALQLAAHHMYPTDVSLSIPRFKTEMKMNLNVAFEMLGLSDLFNTRQSGLESIVKGGENIYVSKTVHKAIIVVSEKGTAGATVSDAAPKQIGMDMQQKVFYANHPFLYFVLYKGDQIFAGTYVD